MLQRWHEIAFFHWSYDPRVLQELLPAGLQIDTFEGKGWITLSPFLLTGFRPPMFPQGFGLTFPEMNLRTYVVGPNGPGIWFFSLDAASPFAVWGARTALGLPYFQAKMRVNATVFENSYTSERGDGANAAIRIVKLGRVTRQTPLDIFLTARFRLYSLFGRKLITAQVEHPPWELNRIRILEFEETVRSTMGVPLDGADFMGHHSPGVDARIGFPRRAK